MADWQLVEEKREWIPAWLFTLLCLLTPRRRWMLRQPFRRILFTKPEQDMATVNVQHVIVKGNLISADVEISTYKQQIDLIRKALDSSQLSDMAKLIAVGSIVNSDVSESDIKRTEELADRFGWERK